MKHFQLQLYQLSRLIKDHIPEIYELFDRNDVSTTLYASSWMLTLFSSSFELGFVTRVYDLLLYASNEVIFRVVLSMLQVHKAELLKLNCFEDIMDYLKNVVPKVDATVMPEIFRHVYELNIARQLLDYKVEYNVLKDEIINNSQHIDSLKMAREDIKNLQRQVQLSEANVERVEGMRHSQQLEIQSMQAHIQSVEGNLQTLGDYITSLSADIEIPFEVRRILQSLECQPQNNKQQVKRRPVFLDRKIGKSVSLNNGVGMSLKVLIEQNESDNQTPPCAVTPTPDVKQSDSILPRKKYFEKSLEQMKHQQNSRNSAKLLLNRESPERPKLIEQAAISESITEENDQCQSHPLVCEDVNFNFNTMQLKSIKTSNAFKKQS
jgi:TBC1 domain family member 4